MGYRVKHVIETDVDGLWRAFFDESLVRAMLRDLGDPADFKIVEQHEDAQGMQHRRIECWSKVELPGFVTKFFGDGSYTEIGCYDSVRKKYSARCMPKHGAEKIGTAFEITASPVGDGSRCERIIDVENTVKVFGLGAMISSVLERTQRATHDHSAKFLNEWLRQQRAAE
jgi:hypothetical protein